MRYSVGVGRGGFVGLVGQELNRVGRPLGETRWGPEGRSLQTRALIALRKLVRSSATALISMSKLSFWVLTQDVMTARTYGTRRSRCREHRCASLVGTVKLAFILNLTRVCKGLRVLQEQSFT